MRAGRAGAGAPRATRGRRTILHRAERLLGEGRLRYCWPAELDAMARLAGLELEERLAWYDGTPFDARSTRHVSVYRRPSVSVRQLVVLGSASQVPTRTRNHNGCSLRWDDEGLLFVPGEGTQRQMTLAGVPASAVTRICVTHFHGDHCLGLPGVLQRMSPDGVTRALPLAYPAAGAVYVGRLRGASAFDDRLELRLQPVDATSSSGDPVAVDDAPAWRLLSAPLRHRVDPSAGGSRSGRAAPWCPNGSHPPASKVPTSDGCNETARSRSPAGPSPSSR